MPTEDILFLRAQRESGRRGSIAGVDLLSLKRHQRVTERREAEAQRRAKESSRREKEAFDVQWASSADEEHTEEALEDGEFTVNKRTKNVRAKMSPAVCSTLWLLRKEYSRLQGTNIDQLQYRQLMGHLLRVSLFAASEYIFLWYQCSSAAMTPRIDITFINGLKAYDDRQAAKVALSAFADHHDYLCGMLIALAFFDENVTNECKRLMVANLYRDSPTQDTVNAAITSTETHNLENFVGDHA